MTRVLRPGPGSMRGLIWLARVGPSPLDPWRFAMGWSEVAARNHARRLEKMGWLERVPMVRGEGSLFFATRTGVRVLGLPLIACTTPAPTWWSHHIACAWTAAWLKVRGRDFLGPRELISSTDWAHPLHWQDRSGVKRSGHRPDLVAFAVSGNPVAIEVELAAKSRSRLAAILRVHRTWSYSNNSRGVVYICGDEAAHSRIERAGKRAGLYLGDGFLRIELLDTIKAQARAEFERTRASSDSAAA
jgi:hypothetical protein